MIRAEVFVEGLRRAGFALVSGTPCSYLTPLINTVIDSAETEYVGAANEGDAVAIACGAELGGKLGVVMFQNSGLGNAVNPLTSLSSIFRIPLLVITTWRGQPGGAADEPQHELMGQITPDLLDVMRIPWEDFPESEQAIAPVLARAVAHMREHRTPYGLIMKGGVVSPHALQTKPDRARVARTAPPRPWRDEEPLEQDAALAAIQSALGATDALLTTTGYSGRALYALGDRPNQLYMVGSMGCVSGLGLGLAKAQPHRRIIVIDGDGALLMRMGLLATLGYEAPPNLVHILLDNGVHDSTGGQGTVSSTADLAAAAWACGYPRVLRAGSAEGLRAALQEREPGLQFIHVSTRPRDNRKLPRPTMTPAEVAERFRRWLLGEREAVNGTQQANPTRHPEAGRKKICLLNPGPVTLTRRVREAMLRPDLCHREPEFVTLQADIRERLVRVYPDSASEYTAVLLTGSGTAAVEAMVGSLVPRDGKALVVENGVYGERIGSMLRTQGKPFVSVRSEWTAPMNLVDVEQTLERDACITHVIAVHHETTTGRLNDLPGLGAICRRRGVALLLDAVSSFGGEPLDLAGWNAEGCASTANKCLHGVPGTCFVLVRKSALASHIDGSSSVYLDLFRHHEAQRAGHPLFTPAVQSLYALQEALRELEESGGWQARHRHYQELSELVREGLHECGAPLLLKEAQDYSAILSSFLLPQGVQFQPMFEHLKRSGFVIYPGQHWLAATIFRVAVMGDLSRRDLEGFLRSFRAACPRRSAGDADKSLNVSSPLGGTR